MFFSSNKRRAYATIKIYNHDVYNSFRYIICATVSRVYFILRFFDFFTDEGKIQHCTELPI